MRLNCIAIDDEPLALHLISSFIEQTSFLNLIGSFGSAVEALEALKVQSVDLVFLDIRMPKLSGMDIARYLHHSPEQPRIVFTTAYNQFAVDSYRVEAIDYLLKPFEYDDFFNAAKKALNYYSLRDNSKPVRNVSQDGYIFVKVGYQSVKVLLESIRYMEGQKDYVRIHLLGTLKPIVTLSTLKLLEEKLPSNQFMRVQRSFIVSINEITAVTRNSIWIGDMEITIGERYKDIVKNVIENR